LTHVQAECPRKFVPLLSPRRYKGAYGGRGSGKSHFFAEQVILACYMAPKRVACIREVQNTIKDSVRQLLIDKIQAFGLGRFFETLDTEIRGKNGSLIVFKGMQSYNAENIKSLENFDVAWVEEAQTLSEKSLTLLRPTIRNAESELWFSWNPRFDTDPVDELFRGKNKHPQAVAVSVNWNDNPWFPDVLLAEKDADFAADPDLAEHVWNGAYQVVTRGAYYARLLLAAEREGRIAPLPHNPSMPVYTAWDLGVGDDTAIWFAQRSGGWIHIIDHYATNGQPASHYVDVLRRKPYQYARHFLPHDADNREWTNGKSRLDALKSLGLENIKVLPRMPVDDGINAVRLLLPTCRFDTENCSNGIKSLRAYQADYDENKRTLKPTPLHNWASHDADAFRYLATGLEPDAAVPADIPRYSGRRRRGEAFDDNSGWAA